MTSEQLTAVHSSRPFQPFRMHLADGRHFDVEHPEFLAYRGGRIAAILSSAERAEFVDLLLVTSLEKSAAQRKSGKSRQAESRLKVCEKLLVARSN